eukprot:CFRG6664T1
MQPSLPYGEDEATQPYTISTNSEVPCDASAVSGAEKFPLTGLSVREEIREIESSIRKTSTPTFATQTPAKKSEKFIRFFREYAILTEYKLLRDHSPPGMYIAPSSETSQIWHGVMFVREGIYESAVFKFDVYIPNNFPTEEVPVIQFTSDVFHPAVEPKTGLVTVSSKWAKWTPHKSHIYDLLTDLYLMFRNLEMMEDIRANLDAYNILMNDANLFKIKVKQGVEKSREDVFSTRNGKGSIHFEPWDNATHEPVLRDILQGKWRSSQHKNFSKD